MKKIHGKTYNGHDIACVLQDAGMRKTVIFCHDLGDASAGDGRFFSTAAEVFAGKGISSLRFDQYGSGNSGGDFFQSGFYDWVRTICAIVADYQAQGHAVALFGHGVGAAAAVAAAAESQGVCAVVALAPRLQLEDFPAPPESPVDEKGQAVQARFWQEAYTARVMDKLAALKAPVCILQCTADEYAVEKARRIIAEKVQPPHVVENCEGCTHGGWTQEQAVDLIGKGADFLIRHFPEQAAAAETSLRQTSQQQRVQADVPVTEKEEVKRKIQQILDEETKKKKPKKPPFDYKKHMNLTIATGGLWAPIWIGLSLFHDYQWWQSQRAAKRWKKDEE